MKERLSKSVNCFEVSFLRRNSVLLGVLFGREALLELREDVMLAISSLSVGCKNIVLLHSFLIQSEKVPASILLFLVVSAIEGK